MLGAEGYRLGLLGGRLQENIFLLQKSRDLLLRYPSDLLPAAQYI